MECALTPAAGRPGRLDRTRDGFLSVCRRSWREHMRRSPSYREEKANAPSRSLALQLVGSWLADMDCFLLTLRTDVARSWRGGGRDGRKGVERRGRRARSSAHHARDLALSHSPPPPRITASSCLNWVGHARTHCMKASFEQHGVDMISHGHYSMLVSTRLSAHTESVNDVHNITYKQLLSPLASVV